MAVGMLRGLGIGRPWEHNGLGLIGVGLEGPGLGLDIASRFWL